MVIHLNKREVARLEQALVIAIEDREAMIDAYFHVPNERERPGWKRDIVAFQKLGRKLAQ